MPDSNYTLEARVADYERRLSKAGGPQEIINELARDMRRGQRLSKLLATLMGLMMFLTGVLIILGIIVWENTNRIQKAARISCLQSVDNTEAINHVLDVLIENTLTTDAFTREEKEKRVSDYQKSKVRVPSCVKEKNV